jgi:hypothetical protein
MLKGLLVNALSRGYKQKEGAPIYLEFSAGCDSTALFFAMATMINEYPFTCVTYFYKQPKIYLNKMNAICNLYKVPLKVVALTKDDILFNVKQLEARGFKGKVLLDCLSGHFPIAQMLKDSIVVNGSYADALYGSYFYHFKPDMTQHAFNTKRVELITKPDADGVQSLRSLLNDNNNLLLTPFNDPMVLEFFMGKSLQECGLTRKTLFKKEFAADLAKVPYTISRKAQQIESGIRDLRHPKGFKKSIRKG